MHNIKESNKTTNNVELAETFNTFFSKTVPNLNIDNNLGDNIIKPNVTDPVLCAIQKYEKHPSILKIKEMMGTNNLLFSFKFIDRKKIFHELQKPESKNVCQGSDIPLKTIKENINFIPYFIYNNFNNSLFSSYFSSNWKNANITPVLKKSIAKTLKTTPCKHSSGSIKSLWKVYVRSNVCILNQDSV